MGEHGSAWRQGERSGADFAALVPQVMDAPTPKFNPNKADGELPGSERPDVRLVDDVIHFQDFSYVADYGTSAEAIAIFGRLFGPQRISPSASGRPYGHACASATAGSRKRAEESRHTHPRSGGTYPRSSGDPERLTPLNRCAGTGVLSGLRSARRRSNRRS